MGKGKQVAITTMCGFKRRRVDAPSASTSAASGNGGGLHRSPADVTSDRHSVLEEPPPPQESTQSIEAQGHPPTAGFEWNFNLEKSPDVPLEALPPVPADCLIWESLPSEEKRATLPEAVFLAMMRCVEQHRTMVG